MMKVNKYELKLNSENMLLFCFSILLNYFMAQTEIASIGNVFAASVNRITQNMNYSIN